MPEGLTGATEVLKDLYGDGSGGPDADKASRASRGRRRHRRPVELNLQYSNDHYGPSSGDEYALIKRQLEESGLFTVNLQTTEWVQYSKDRSSDVYPAYQLGWFPDYSDADNYLTPFFLIENFLANHYDEPGGQRPDPRAGVDRRPRRARRRDRGDPGEGRRGPVDRSAAPGRAGRRRRRRRRRASPLDASFKFRYAALTK